MSQRELRSLLGIKHSKQSEMTEPGVEGPPAEGVAAIASAISQLTSVVQLLRDEVGVVRSAQENQSNRLVALEHTMGQRVPTAGTQPAGTAAQSTPGFESGAEGAPSAATPPAGHEMPAGGGGEGGRGAPAGGEPPPDPSDSSDDEGGGDSFPRRAHFPADSAGGSGCHTQLGQGNVGKKPSYRDMQGLPIFKGERSRLRGWLQDTQLWIREWAHLDSFEKAFYIAKRLEGDARDVYHAQCRLHGDDRVTWAMLRKALEEHFCYVNEVKQARRRLRSLSQGRDTVVSYFTQLRKLLSTPGMEQDFGTESAKVDLAFDGLRAEIQRELEQRDFSTLDQLLAAAVRVEQRLKSSPGGKAAVKAQLAAILTELVQEGSEEEGGSDDEGAAGGSEPLAALQRYVPPHLRKALRPKFRPRGRGPPRSGREQAGSAPPPSPAPGERQRPPAERKSRPKTTDRCNNCGELGHWARDCPNGTSAGAVQENRQGRW